MTRPDNDLKRNGSQRAIATTKATIGTKNSPYQIRPAPTYAGSRKLAHPLSEKSLGTASIIQLVLSAIANRPVESRALVLSTSAPATAAKLSMAINRPTHRFSKTD